MSGIGKVFLPLEVHDDDLARISRSHKPTDIGADADADPCILAVDRQDLYIIRFLGEGRFCRVNLVALSLPRREIQKDSCTGVSGGGTQPSPPMHRIQYACKFIDLQQTNSADDLIVAATDLASEAKILSELDHPNVIKLRGLCSESFSSSFSEFEIPGVHCSSSKMSTGTRTRTNRMEGYFLILDYLGETLSARLTRQHNEEQANNKKSQKLLKRFTRNTKSTTNGSRDAMYKRIKHIVTGVVDGMQYLHSQDIVHRDLKPANVGFDEEDNVQIFDFGMARRLSECDFEGCGTLPYMAPEIMNESYYTLKVDVFSFGVTLFELCSLQRRRMMKKERTSVLVTIVRGKRKQSSASEKEEHFRTIVKNEDHLEPVVDLEGLVPCRKMRELIRECWSFDPNRRPTFEQIQHKLRNMFQFSSRSLKTDSTNTYTTSIVDGTPI